MLYFYCNEQNANLFSSLEIVTESKTKPLGCIIFIKFDQRALPPVELSISYFYVLLECFQEGEGGSQANVRNLHFHTWGIKSPTIGFYCFKASIVSLR